MANRWQYNTVELKPGFARRINAGRIQEELVRQGAAGWELVQVLHNGHGLQPAILVFKKEA